MFLGLFQFLLGYLIRWAILFHSSLLWFFAFVWYLISFLILFESFLLFLGESSSRFFSNLLTFNFYRFFKMSYNCHITLYLFQIYYIVIQYLYTLLNDHQSKLIYHPSPYIVENWVWWELLSKFHIHNCYTRIVNYSHHAAHYILMTYLFCNWQFLHFDSLHPNYTPSSQTLVCSLIIGAW